jgi:hypothetical protein
MKHLLLAALAGGFASATGILLLLAAFESLAAV